MYEAIIESQGNDDLPEEYLQEVQIRSKLVNFSRPFILRLLDILDDKLCPTQKVNTSFRGLQDVILAADTPVTWLTIHGHQDKFVFLSVLTEQMQV